MYNCTLFAIGTHISYNSQIYSHNLQIYTQTFFNNKYTNIIEFIFNLFLHTFANISTQFKNRRIYIINSNKLL